MFGITAHYIHIVERQTQNLRSGNSQVSTSSSEKERFAVYVRLFIMMGITWIMDSLSWIFKDNGYLFYVTDFLNSIQGIIIFFLFVWKPKVRDLVVERYLN